MLASFCNVEPSPFASDAASGFFWVSPSEPLPEPPPPLQAVGLRGVEGLSRGGKVRGGALDVARE
ncbi:hypothetical protein, partial [Gordonibacter urolithinfaciens]|uniref:hypothetical protein n=1 Tax=Gordonibacter urolithinfaciens TaxID=1335613 RepID=UPI001EE474FB